MTMADDEYFQELKNTDDPIDPTFLVSVDRPEELEQIARYLMGKQVILLYKDTSGDYREWSPDVKAT